MKVLVVGADGQVGRALCESDESLIGVGRRDLDIVDLEATAEVLSSVAPTIVVNAAAYTSVDLAEDEPQQAFSVNQTGPENLAKVCADRGIPLVHLSTDYVFDGTADAPYVETDTVNPQGVYGESKLAGEVAIQSVLAEYVILRTSWVFSAYRGNFVRTMLQLFAERDQVSVVADQVGCPTSARQIAGAVLTIVNHLQAGSEQFGTFHFSGAPAVSWFEFAEAILLSAHNAGADFNPKLIPISTAEYPTKAKRPAYSVLDNRKLQEKFGIESSPWRPEVDQVVAALLAS